MPVLFGPDEGVFPLAELPLDGCRWCGVITKYEHMQRWAPQPIGWHTWTPLNQAQIKERMLARRSARLTAEPYLYHAATAWAPSADGEEGIPFCADCKTDGCRRWLRVQAKLDRIRWGVAEPKGFVRGGWGGDEPW